MKTLDIHLIRYLNLFEKISKIRTKNCFVYNNTILFSVPSSLISKAIGEQGRNIKRMSELLDKKIKIVGMPYDAERFISEIVAPVKFKSLAIQGNEIVINAGRQSKAALIGRNKTRLEELNNITKEYFGKEVRIV
jgi:NusA-like KH domain protein